MAAGILAREGRKITGRTMDLFLSKTGDDMDNIRMELEKLISYTMGREIITDQDVEEICITQAANQIFDMISALAAGQTRRAMDLYEDLLTLKEPPMRILFLIARQFNQILQVKELASKGMDKGSIAAKMKIQPFVVGKVLPADQGIFQGTDSFIRRIVRSDGRRGKNRTAFRPSGSRIVIDKGVSEKINMKRPFFTLAVGFVLGEVLALQGKMAGITALAKGLAAFMAVCAAVYFLMMVKGRGLKRLLPFALQLSAVCWDFGGRNETSAFWTARNSGCRNGQGALRFLAS